MEFQVAETIEALEMQHAALKRRIAELVEAAQTGASDGTQIPKLTREAAVLASRIEAAKAERDHAERTRRREERQQASADLAEVLPAAMEQRDSFLSHYREACVALGRYMELRARACELTNKMTTSFGVLLHDQSALRELELGNKPAEILSGLTPDVGAGWKMSFPVTPMYDKTR